MRPTAPSHQNPSDYLQHVKVGVSSEHQGCPEPTPPSRCLVVATLSSLRILQILLETESTIPTPKPQAPPTHMHTNSTGAVAFRVPHKNRNNRQKKQKTNKTEPKHMTLLVQASQAVNNVPPSMRPSSIIQIPVTPTNPQ
jgi:hypothetical protein